ncbi:hypothetical protein [Faecalibacillus faecis]
MKRLNPADYEERQLEDFSKYNNAGNKGAGGNERNNWRRNNIILV